MKLPDITLFFQMVHFLFAYWALRKFIFAPALAIIQGQEQKNQYLVDKVHIARTNLKESIEQQQNRWNFIKKSLMDMAPTINLQKCFTTFKVTAPVETPKIKISQSDKDAIQKTLQNKLLDIT